MTWSVYGKPYYNDSDMTDTSIYQRVSFREAKTIRAMLVDLIFYNDPTFTDLTLKIYGVGPSGLIYTSSPRIKTALGISEPYAVSQVYFEFNDVALAAETEYDFVLNASGYTGNGEGKHIAWKTSFPDPINAVDLVDHSYVKLANYPLVIKAIDARFAEA